MLGMRPSQFSLRFGFPLKVDGYIHDPSIFIIDEIDIICREYGCGSQRVDGFETSNKSLFSENIAGLKGKGFSQEGFSNRGISDQNNLSKVILSALDDTNFEVGQGTDCQGRQDWPG